MFQFLRFWVRDGIVESHGTIFCVVLQLYLDVIMPDENEEFVLFAVIYLE